MYGNNPDWYLYPDNRVYCYKHKWFFPTGDVCEHCEKEAQKTKPTQSPPFPLELKKPKKGVSPKNHGNGCKITETVVNLKGVVVENHRNGCSQTEIAQKFGISQQYVSKILRAWSGKNPKQKFHNFSLTFSASYSYEGLSFKEITIKRTVYKVFKNNDFRVQLFKNGSVVVRCLKDIFHNNVVKTNDEAVHYVFNFLKDFKKEFGLIIDFQRFKISSGHNAFTDNEIAKDMLGKGQEIKYYDKNDGKLRTEVDMSNGVPEFEHEHPKHFVKDSSKWEDIIHDVATDNYLPLSVTKKRIEGVEGSYADALNDLKENALKPLTAQIQLHLGVQEQTLQTQKEMAITMREIRSDLKEGRDLDSISVSEFKRRKIKKILKDYGW